MRQSRVGWRIRQRSWTIEKARKKVKPRRREEREGSPRWLCLNDRNVGLLLRVTLRPSRLCGLPLDVAAGRQATGLSTAKRPVNTSTP